MITSYTQWLNFTFWTHLLQLILIIHTETGHLHPDWFVPTFKWYQNQRITHNHRIQIKIITGYTQWPDEVNFTFGTNLSQLILIIHTETQPQEIHTHLTSVGRIREKQGKINISDFATLLYNYTVYHQIFNCH